MEHMILQISHHNFIIDFDVKAHKITYSDKITISFPDDPNLSLSFYLFQVSSLL